MNQSDLLEADSPAGSAAAEGSQRTLPWLLLLLAGSGCAGLIYEIVWFQLLQLVIGSSAISLGLLLASYMGGLCWGSAALPRYVSRKFHPLKIYAYLELGVGVFGLLALVGVPIVGRVYLLGGSSEGMFGLVLRGVVAAACLLPPTLLMGGSLPAIARWVETTPKGVSWMGYLYSANIAGAVMGGLVAGFYLLRVHDMIFATFAAVALNTLVGLAALFLAGRARHTPAPEKAPAPSVLRAPGANMIYIAIALSGLGALGAEVVWTRLLSLLLGATVYTFSIILAVYLIGLWAGSSAGSYMARRLKNPRLMLAACQALLAAAVAWTGYTMSNSLPFWPVDPWLSLDPVFNFQLDLVRCAWAIFPATILWGASFPLALASVAAEGQDPGRLSGEIYAANTAGSIVGALLFSLILIPNIGTTASQQILIVISLLGAATALASLARMPRLRPKKLVPVSVAAALVGLSLLAVIKEVPWELVAYGRRLAPTARGLQLDPRFPTKVLFRGEGINSSVLIAERAGQRHFYVSGKAEASTALLDMRLERLMGAVPGLVHPNPQSVLIVGFGAGVTAGSFVPYPEIKSITICELEPFIPPASTQYFGPQNYQVLNDPRTRIIYDDARHYVYTTDQKYDVITTDPIHPWVKGTSVLYSKEYYELVKQHLNPGGVVAQWLPIYDSDPATVKSELATFFDVFPHGTVWSNYTQIGGQGDGYDLVLLGRVDDDAPISVDALQERLDKPDHARLAQSLAEIGFHSAVDFLATYVGRAVDLAPYLVDAQINNDMNMRLQFLAGLGLNSMAYQNIYLDMLQYRKFPEGLLQGTGGRIDALRTLIRPGRR